MVSITCDVLYVAYIGRVRYIHILTWLRSFHDGIAIKFLFFHRSGETWREFVLKTSEPC